MKNIKKISIIGMGALGLMYGDFIESCEPGSVTFVMDDERFEKYSGEAFSVNGTSRTFNMTAKPEIADLLIIAVKYPSFEEALSLAEKCIGSDTVIICVMNGIVSEGIIAKRFGSKNVVYTIARGMDTMKFGSEVRFSKMGKLVVGIINDEQKEAFESLKGYFERIGMPYVDEDEIIYRKWEKLLINVGANQPCMVYQVSYRGILSPGEPHDVALAAMREVVAVANAEGVPLSEDNIRYAIELERTLDPEAIPSMAQDRVNKKQSEVDIFAGTIMELAKKHGIDVPANKMIYQKVKEIEAEYC